MRKLIPSALLKLLEKPALSAEDISAIFGAVDFLKPWYHHDNRKEDSDSLLHPKPD
jgi:hypothetical protein